uniref:Uncharacterized protein n=1 Tax=Dulem virus 40 TaxID=3145758 RepID=A0AAU8AVK6_9CAUD
MPIQRSHTKWRTPNLCTARITSWRCLSATVSPRPRKRW